MSLTAPDFITTTPPDDPDADGPWVEPVQRPESDALVVTCGACGTRQHAPSDALGYTCHTCGSTWQAKRCRGCRRVSVVLDGAPACPRCGHEYQTVARESRETAARLPSWLTEPEPLSVWVGGVKYLGGHAEQDQPVSAAGLLLDRRGIHLRAFAELFTMRWDDVRSIDIEGPLDISERMSMTRLLELGATTWAMRVAYLTVRTANGDAIFEVDGLGPPELHARLSRVLQGLQRSDRPPAPIAIDRPITVLAQPDTVVTPAVAAPAAAPPIPVAIPMPIEAPPIPVAVAAPEPAPELEPVAVDALHSDAPLEVLVVDALWKLARLRDIGLLDDAEVGVLRSRLLARVSELAEAPFTDSGPLLHV